MPSDTTAGRVAILSTLYEVNAYETLIKLSGESYPHEVETIHWITSALLITNRFQEAQTTLQENASLFFHEQINSERRTTLSLIWAICQWKLFGRLQESLLPLTPEPLHFGLDYIDQCLLQQEVLPLGKDNDRLVASLMTELITLSVQLQQPTLGQSLVDLIPDLESILAIALYKEGYFNAAGEHFITLVCDNRAKGNVLFYIGEMMMDKGHYSEASKWFQQALEQESANEAASIGLSLCYLHLAMQHMEDANEELQVDYTYGPFQEDIGGIQRAISFLSRTPWHTQWSFHQSQRRK